VGLVEHDRSDDQLCRTRNGRDIGSIDDYLCRSRRHFRFYEPERHDGNTGFDQCDSSESFGGGRKYTPIHGDGNVQQRNDFEHHELSDVGLIEHDCSDDQLCRTRNGRDSGSIGYDLCNSG
jgi:hypothetical protein